MPRKNNYLIYNLSAIFRFALPRPVCLKEKILKDVEKRSDYGYIKERVDYYNRLDSNFESKKLDSNYQIKSPQSAPIDIKNFPIPRKRTVYFFDTFEIARYFNGKLLLESGDVNYFLDKPSIVKSRPIARNENDLLLSANSCVLNLEKIRHFLFIKDPFRFEEKDDIIFFRGGAYQAHRARFFEKYFNHPNCDLGHSGKIKNENLKIWSKPKVDIKTHLKHKFIVSLEGNDVATNLKWIMSSNSVVVSPKLKFETWFMEGKLKGDYHYIEIDENYENLFDKIDFYKKNPEKAKEIARRANEYCAQFFDKKRELIISLLVFEKYLKYTEKHGIFESQSESSTNSKSKSNLEGKK